jgi:hypothetical protein
VLITPHIAFSSIESSVEMRRLAGDEIARADRPRFPVNQFVATC